MEVRLNAKASTEVTRDWAQSHVAGMNVVGLVTAESLIGGRVKPIGNEHASAYCTLLGKNTSSHLEVASLGEHMARNIAHP